MTDNQETSADIIAEMRRRIAVKMSDAWYTQEEWRKLCDRLEAAIRREKAAVEADALEVGGIVGAAHRREMSKNTSKNGADFGQLGDCAKTVDLRFDICRDIEQVLKIGRDYQNKDGYRGAHYDTVKLLCDAIEYQQEQLKTKTEVGDCAKLREALGKIRAELWNNTVIAGKRKFELYEIADAALAAPARNCDRFRNAGEALEALERHCNSSGNGCMRCPLVGHSTEELSCKIGWLLASATEKEGGAI